MTVEEALALVEQVLAQKHLNQVQKLVFREAWEGKSYADIARGSGYDPGYIKDTGSKLWQLLSESLDAKVTKHNFQAVLQQVSRQAQPVLTTNVTVNAAGQGLKSDWGDAIDTTLFYGRTQERTLLNQWIVQDRCRLVTLLGMGGIGKTALSVKVAEQLQSEFEFLIWRSLRDAPPIDELLTTLIQFLSGEAAPIVPDGVGSKLSCLVDLLRRSRCLIVLDNFDAVLQSGKRAGTYRNAYQDYGEFLRRVGELTHQSCIMLTSREKPEEVAALAGDRLPVRTLPLAGLDTAAGQHILSMKGVVGPQQDTEQLIALYCGNPLVLKIAATSIQDLFAGDISQFLHQGTAVFNGIGNLLAQQVDRLSDLEQHLMQWLAIHREPVSPAELQADLVPELSKPKLMEVLESLKWRSLIESSAIGFTQQPVVMEYITERLIEQVSDEIVAETPQCLLSHALMKAQAKEYIRDSQVRVIVQPVVDRLLATLGSAKQVEHKLSRLLVKLRSEFSRVSAYGAGNLLNLFRQLETDLTGYDFSHLNIAQAYLQDVNLQRVNFAEAEFSHCAFAATFGGITSVAFSPDGHTLATSDTNGAIQIWSTVTGQQLLTCTGHNSWVWRVVFSPRAPILASCGQDHTVRLWDTQTGQCLKVLHGHSSIVTDLAFHPHTQQLASSSEDQTIKLWELETGRCIATLQGHHACVWSLAFAPDGKTLLSAGEDNALRVWDLATEQCVQTLRGHGHWIKAIALSPDGQHVVSGSFDGTIKCWDVATGDCLHTLQGHQGAVVSVAFSPDGTTLASGSYDQTVKLWHLQTGACLTTLQKHTNRVWTVAFHPQGQILASGGDDNTTRLWSLPQGQAIKTLQGHSNSIYSIALNAGQRLLVSGHEDQTIKLWDLDLPDLNPGAIAQPFKVLRGHSNRVFSVAFSPDGQRLASASLDRTIKLWNPHTGQCLNTLQGHKSWVWAVSFSPDGQRLASASYDHTVKLWDMQTGECVQTLTGHSSSVLSIAFSTTGQQLVSGGYEQTIQLWHLETGHLKTLQGHTNRVWTVAFSPDDQQLATGGDDRTVKLWDSQTGECLQSFEGHSSQVLSVLFTPDGKTLFSSSADKTIKRWDLATGTCVETLQGHTNWVWSLALSPDGNTLLSGGQDETIQSWDLASGKCLQTRRVPRPYEGMDITAALGLTEGQRASLKALGAVER